MKQRRNDATQRFFSFLFGSAWKGIATAAALVGAQFFAVNLFDEATGDFGDAISGSAARAARSPNAVDASDDDAPSRRLLKESILRLEESISLSAEFDFEASTFGERYFGRGRYEERSESTSTSNGIRRNPLEQTRFRLRASTGKSVAQEKNAPNGEENVLEVVCDVDRKAVWTYSSIEKEKRLSHVGVEELTDALSRLDDEERQTLRDAGVGKPCGTNGLPGLGGLSGTLKSLGAAYRFAPNVENAEPIGNVEVVKIVGTIKPERAESWSKRYGVETLEPYLAENAPFGVEIYFGKDWPFPYRIEYFSVDGDENKTRRAVFSVEYSSVARNDANASSENFIYNQPQINFDRATVDYLERLIPGIRQ